MKRVIANVLAAIGLASLVLVFASAIPVYASAGPSHANPDNEGHHYGWYKHTTPPPAPTPQPTSTPTSQPTPHNAGNTLPTSNSGGNRGTNQDPPAVQTTTTTATDPSAKIIGAPATIVIAAPKSDDLALWVIYILLVGLSLIWLLLVALATVRSARGRPAPKAA